MANDAFMLYHVAVIIFFNITVTGVIYGLKQYGHNFQCPFFLEAIVQICCGGNFNSFPEPKEEVKHGLKGKISLKLKNLILFKGSF